MDVCVGCVYAAACDRPPARPPACPPARPPARSTAPARPPARPPVRPPVHPPAHRCQFAQLTRHHAADAAAAAAVLQLHADAAPRRHPANRTPAPRHVPHRPAQTRTAVHPADDGKGSQRRRQRDATLGRLADNMAS